MFKFRRSATSASLLHHPDFLRLWLGLSISYLGDQFTMIALLWFVLQVTGSAVAVGLVILCFQLPSILTGSLLGSLLDRFQPRLVMGIDNITRALLIGAIPSLYLLGLLQLWQIYVLALLAGALSPATNAGVRVVLPCLISDEKLEHANALTSTSVQFASLLGPVLAGVIIARSGAPWALFFDALSFLIMGLLVFSLPPIQQTSLPTGNQAGTKRDRLGFRTLWQIKEVRLLTILSLVFFFAYGPLEAALPVYSAQILHAGAEGYGLLWSGFGVGALTGILLVSLLVKRLRPGISQPLIAILWGLFLCPLVLIHNLLLAMLFLALAAFCWAPYATIEISLLQRLIPTHLRGQVFGARLAIVTAAAPLGALLGGLLLQVVSAPVIIGISGAACIVAGVGGLLSPTMRGLRRKSL